MELEAVLRLYLLLEQRAGPYRQLLAVHGEASAALSALQRSVAAAAELPPALAARVADWRAGRLEAELAVAVERTLVWLEQPGNGIWLDSDVDDPPPAFASLSERPPLLFQAGHAVAMLLPQVAIVGSRAATRQGLALSAQFAAALARRGLAVVSGLASGIDGAAHRGALDTGGATIAVMGCGLDRVYPPQHRGLADEILAHDGLLLSEFAPGTPPLARHFPRRNRIISALALGVLVVEAGPDSGSISTAKAANQMSREVWAVPGSVHSLTSRGCHQLIRNGVAQLVETPEQVLQGVLPLLRTVYRKELTEMAADPGVSATPSRMSPDALGLQLLEVMGWSVTDVETLLAQVYGSPGETLACLGELEVAGWIGAVPGGYQRLPP